LAGAHRVGDAGTGWQTLFSRLKWAPKARL
jgi:hypothetical protein